METVFPVTTSATSNGQTSASVPSVAPMPPLSVVGGQPFQQPASLEHDLPVDLPQSSFPAFHYPHDNIHNNPFVSSVPYQQTTAMSSYEEQQQQPSMVPPVPVQPTTPAARIIGSSLEEMGRNLSEAGHNLKTGGAFDTIPILQDLVQKITHEVAALTPAFDGMSLAPKPGSQSGGSPPLQLLDPGPSRKRAASPLQLDPIRPQKALRPMKVEPTDEPLQSNLPLSSAGLSASFGPPMTSPHPPMGSLNSDSLSSAFDLPAVPISEPLSSQPSPTWNTTGPIRHQHTHSAGSIVPISGTAASQVNGVVPVIGRVSRSGSLTTGYTPPKLNYEYPEQPQNPYPVLAAPTATVPSPPWPSNVAVVPPSDLLPPSIPPGAPGVWPQIPDISLRNADFNDREEGEDEDDGDEDEPSPHARSPDSPGMSTSGDIPIEYQPDVDRIFFDFLNNLCSNLEATDSKGEPIHQTLMAKKMKRLDESGDFRPFKFRIAAFTTRFLECLAEEGYPEDKIPMKKVRNYLWHQPYILRFNEEGKKAKSKGNHIWNIDARKVGEGQWEFRPFQRRLAGFPSGIAYRGLPWSYSARIWDPQSSWQNVPVTYGSPNLPSWLSWKDNVLSGVPGSDAASCDVTVIAKYNYHGQDGQLTHTFHLNVAPQSLDTVPSRVPSRRPSLVGEQRSLTDGAVPRSRRNSVAAAPSDILHVMENVKAQASNDLGAHQSNGQDYQNLVKQAHVLEKTVSALVETRPHSETRALCDAANGVVMSAAKVVFSQLSSSRPPSMNEVSCLTKAAITEAVVMNGTRSNEVDIILTAESILKTGNGSSPTISRPQTAPLVGMS